MIPRMLKSATASSTTGEAYILAKAISCEVVEELNGGYELTMQIPSEDVNILRSYNNSGNNTGGIIVANPNNVGNEQPFRIYSIDVGRNTAEVKAAHISNDLNYIPIRRFKASNMVEVIARINESIHSNSGSGAHTYGSAFTISTNINRTFIETSQFGPCSVREVLDELHKPDYAGGDIYYDGWNVSLLTARAVNRGVILYKDANIDMSIAYDGSERLNGAMVYGITDDDVALYAQSAITFLDDSKPPVRAEAVDVREKYNSTLNPTVAVARMWLTQEGRQNEAYTRKVDTLNINDNIHQISVGDVIAVNQIACHVTKTVYDVLRNRTLEIELDGISPTVGSVIWTR